MPSFLENSILGPKLNTETREFMSWTLTMNFFVKPHALQEAVHELQKEELYPYGKGEWLKLKSAEEKVTSINKLITPHQEKTTGKLKLKHKLITPREEKVTTSWPSHKSSVGKVKDKEDNEEKDRTEIGEHEEYKDVLRGPIWSYPCRRSTLDFDYYNYILFNMQRPTLKTPEEMILKGEKWVAKKQITLSLAAFLMKRIKKMNPAKTAMLELETGRTLTYGEYSQKAESLASGLHWLGIQPEKVVAIVSFNSIEAHLMMLACLLIGAVVALVDSSLNPAELGIVIRMTSPHFVFTEVGKTQYKVETAIGYLSLSLSLKPQLIINSNTLPESCNYFLFHQLLKEIDPEAITPGPHCADPFRPIMILYSGNEENLRGCLIPEQYFTNNKAFLDTVLPPHDDPEITMMVTSPMFCGMAIRTILNSLIEGYRIIFCRGPIPEPCLISALHKFEVFTMLTSRETLLNLLYWMARPRCPKLKLVVVTGLPLRLKNFTKIHNELFNKEVRVLQLYDLAETGLVAANKPLENKFGSMGKLYYNVEMKVLDEGTNIVLGPNQEGEICVKSPTMLLGYYNCNDNDRVDKKVTDSEGFIHTGDIGYYDEQGFVFVFDKISDIIKWRMYSVTPTQIATLLMEQPEVKEAVVFGVFDEEAGELVTAAVIFDFGYEGTDVAVFEKQVNALLPYYRRIRGGVYVFHQFPRSSIGKPVRKLILKEVLERKLIEQLGLNKNYP